MALRLQRKFANSFAVLRAGRFRQPLPDNASDTPRLRNNSLAQRREGHVAQVHPVEAYDALARVHQPSQQLGERGLARPGLADDRDFGHYR